MNKRYSIFLDLIRFMAALSVAFYHFSDDGFTNGNLSFINKSVLGHNAVVIFFVLSGFVIYYSVLNKPTNLMEYLGKRLTRLHSVLIPALIIVFVVDTVGSNLDPSIYQGKVADTQIIFRFLINALFLQEVQFNNFRYMSNGPLWSLGYEFWYYIIFGLFFLVKNNPFRVFSIILVSCLVGIKILLLFPVWLLGIFVFKLISSGRFRQVKLCSICLIISVIVFIALTFTDLRSNLIQVSEVTNNILGANDSLRFSYYWIHDFLLGLLFAVIMFCTYVVTNALTLPSYLHTSSLERVIRKLADSTLTLYVFHYPLLLFAYSIATYIGIKTTLAVDFFLFLIVVAVCYLLSLIFESRNSYGYKLIQYGVMVSLAQVNITLSSIKLKMRIK